MKTYVGKITKLLPNQIFVFGSNTQGRHGKGAALWALKNAGAIYGKSRGLQGQSYAIITKDLSVKPYKGKSIPFICREIYNLYGFAYHNPDLEFLVAYSGVGTNLNGYTPQEMADIFSSTIIPDNIVFEEEFYKLIMN